MQSEAACSSLKSIFLVMKFNLNSSLSVCTWLFSCNFFKPCYQSNQCLKKLTKAEFDSSKYINELGIEEPFRNFGLDGQNILLACWITFKQSRHTLLHKLLSVCREVSTAGCKVLVWQNNIGWKLSGSGTKKFWFVCYFILENNFFSY